MIRTLLLLLLLTTMPVLARESAPVTSRRAVVTLVTDTDARDGQPFRAALRLRLAPGWHSYWQNPGDAGVAPDLQFDAPASAGPITWPAPQIIAEGPVTTYAYTGDVLLPVTISAPAGALALRAHASWLVCERICVPEEGDFAIDMPAGTPAPSAEAPLFAAAAARSPVPSPYAATIAPDGTLTLKTDGMAAGAVAKAAFFPASAGQIDAGAAQSLSAKDGSLTLKLTPATGFDPQAKLAGLLVLTDAKGGQTYLDVTASPGGVAADGLARVLLLALAGGLVLNLMPCVFPVLAMKAMALAQMAGEARSQIRAHAAYYTAGVMIAFVALGAALLGARAAGGAAGWGFQFQSPAFVAAMAWLLFAVGLNLSGVFAIGGKLAGAGQSLAGRGGNLGSLFTGFLAVVVATPCTAPFMAAAIAGALAAPPATTLLVFAAMGLGLALPYALLAAGPGLARFLPRPGAWMETLRQVLAFPMYGAAVWLLWVVSQEAGPDGVLAVGGGLLAVGFAAWAFGRTQGGARRRLGAAAAVLGIAVALAILPDIKLATAGASAAESSEAYTPDRLAALRAEGRPVFVNMTAAWCVSCLVNERIALSPAAVRDAFAANKIAYLKGDWTRQDPIVSAFLRDHGREGVPLYIYYGPGRPPAVLPQILTVATVLDAIRDD
jgi:thiol:disulfide interchange protein DsbD